MQLRFLHTPKMWERIPRSVLSARTRYRTPRSSQASWNRMSMQDHLSAPLIETLILHLDQRLISRHIKISEKRKKSKKTEFVLHKFCYFRKSLSKLSWMKAPQAYKHWTNELFLATTQTQNHPIPWNPNFPIKISPNENPHRRKTRSN